MLSPRGWVAAAFLGCFVVFMAALIAAVVVNSLGTRWLDDWLPDAFTTHWYGDAWREFGLTSVLLVTVQIAGAVVGLSLLIGVPAAYALARRDFPAGAWSCSPSSFRCCCRPSRTGSRWRPCCCATISAAR